MSTATARLYETDFYGWIQEQSSLIRSGDTSLLDYENILEEIEAMGRAERRSLRSRLAVLLMHLLKWQYQPTLRGKSWRATITHQRTAISSLLEDSPGLQNALQDRVDSAWKDALKDVVAETDLDKDIFPQVCPWSFDTFMDDGFWPEESTNAASVLSPA